MKYLQMFLAMIVMVGVLVCATSQSVLAQDLTEETTDLIIYDEIMSYFFSDEYDQYFEEDEIGVQSGTIALCAVPKNAKAEQTGRNVLVSWTKGAGLTPSYNRVYMDGNLKSTVSGTMTSGAITNVTSGPHSIYVTALDSSGAETVASNIVSYTPEQPVVPTGVAATPAGSGQVTIRWAYRPQPGSYAVYRTNGATWTQVWNGLGTYTGTATTITGIETTITCPAGYWGFAVTSLRPWESNKSSTKWVTVP